MAPLTALAVLAALVLVFCVVGLVDHVKRLIRAHGLIRLIVRYLSGQHHTGMPQTDATWSTPGTRALTQTGHCRAFWLKPRRERAKIRCTRAASVAGSCFGLAEMRLATLTLLGCLTLYGKYRLYRSFQHRRAQAAHYRDLVLPLHHAVHALCGQPASLPARDWIAVEPDRSRIELRLPAGTTFSDRHLDRLVKAAGSAIALSSPRAVPGPVTAGTGLLTVPGTGRPGPVLTRYRRPGAGGGHDRPHGMRRCFQGRREQSGGGERQG